MKEVPLKVVHIPITAQHEGVYGANVCLRWVCPVCGKPRGEIKKSRSYDGSLYMVVDSWDNPCGHIDKYSDVYNEAKNNGLNNKVTQKRNTHKSNELDRLIGKTVEITFYDNEVVVGLLETNKYKPPYEIICNRYGTLCFYKSHIKSIKEVTP